MSLIGKKISDFAVQGYQNEDFKEVTQNDLQGHWSVFVFYPADFTFVCPTELGDLADHYAEFQKVGCEIYSVSTDSHFVHKAWHDTSDTIQKITYPMLADPAGVLAREFDVLVEKDWQALRGSFVINPEGVIVAYEVHDMGIGRNSEELLRKVQAAQFVAEHGDQVCPAKWKPGEETLKPSFGLVGKI
ncbi:MAG: alkyl hydroperoxide reductase subunit C [Oscillospiraceae bacterium]